MYSVILPVEIKGPMNELGVLVNFLRPCKLWISKGQFGNAVDP